MPPEKVNLLEEAVEVAKNADAVILVVGTNSDWETEGNDRADLSLPANQDQLIENILKETSVEVSTEQINIFISQFVGIRIKN